VGRLTRGLAWRLAAAGLLAGAVLAMGAEHAAAFDGFGDSTADSTYGQEIRFEMTLEGDNPERLEILIRTPGSDGSLVVPVSPSGSAAEYVWDTSVNHVVPNTLLTYQWRASDGDEVTLSEEEEFRYVDDRPGLDWQRVQLGESTVHWYGDGEDQALRFGELSAVGVERAEQLLGTELAAPVDVFVYTTADDFFGALGPGAREWTGAAAFSELRTIFMWNSSEAGSHDYLETVMIHEITHIVFHDATDNPFHEPARWLNEGFATWSESQDASEERAIVEQEAEDGLFSFDAITEQFPIGQRGGRLSYAQGTTMIELIINEYGREAMASIAAAYREGASDAEALEAGTGVTADRLYADFFSEFGADEPTPIEPEPIPASNVDRPTAGDVDPGGVDPGAEPPPGDAVPGEGGGSAAGTEAAVIAALAIGLTGAGGAAWAMTRRAERRSRP
jgi:Peptidase MA superfamily